MTKVVYTALAVVVGGFCFSACKKKEDTNTTNTANANKGRLVCIADSKEWISDAPGKLHKIFVYDSFMSFTQEVYGTEATLFGDTLYFSGARVAGADSSGINFTVVLNPGRIGTYTIGLYPPTKAGTAAACFYNKLGVKQLNAGYYKYNTSGTFEVTDFSDSLRTVSGKFHFDMSPKNSANSSTPPHSVKNGVFIETKIN